MGGSLKTTEEIAFSVSRSTVQSLAEDIRKKAFAEDRALLICSPQHIVGSICIVMYMYAICQQAVGGWKEKDWGRVAGSAATLPSQFVALFSKRAGVHPDADRFTERVKQAASHPDTHSMHAQIAYGGPGTVITGINNIYKALTGTGADSVRMLSGTLGLVSQTMLWQSLFGRKEGIGQTQQLKQGGEKESFLRFVLHDMDGLSARILPMTTRIINLTEGILKIREGREAGKNLKMSAVVDLVSYFVSMAYQYQRLWSAHKEKNADMASPKAAQNPNTAPNGNWTKEILEANSAQPHTVSVKTR